MSERSGQPLELTWADETLLQIDAAKEPEQYEAVFARIVNYAVSDVISGEGNEPENPANQLLAYQIILRGLKARIGESKHIDLVNHIINERPKIAGYKPNEPLFNAVTREFPEISTDIALTISQLEELGAIEQEVLNGEQLSLLEELPAEATRTPADDLVEEMKKDAERVRLLMNSEAYEAREHAREDEENFDVFDDLDTLLYHDVVQACETAHRLMNQPRTHEAAFSYLPILAAALANQALKCNTVAEANNLINQCGLSEPITEQIYVRWDAAVFEEALRLARLTEDIQQAAVYIAERASSPLARIKMLDALKSYKSAEPS